MARKRTKKQRMVYGLLGILAVVAVAALLISFNRQQKIEQQRLAERQMEIQVQNKIDDTIDAIKENAEMGSDDTMMEEPETSFFIVGQNALEITTQEIGTAVIFKNVVVDNPSFIVVLADNAGEPGEVIATSSLLERGAYQLVSIAVPEALKTRTTYYAAIAQDADGNGQYTESTDSFFTKTDGSTVATVTFKAQ